MLRRMSQALLLVLALASVASAQPSLAPELPPPPPAVTNSVDAGATFGGTTAGDLYTGLSIGGGHRISHLFWIHAALATVTTPELSTGWSSRGVTSDRFTDVRGGIELRGCVRSERVCGLIGVDVGYRHELFDHMNRSGGEAVFRLGGDVGLGSRHLRLRSVFEGTSTKIADTEALTFLLAYLW